MGMNFFFRSHFNYYFSSIHTCKDHLYLKIWAQLFEGRLALTQGQILIWVSLFLYSKAFLGKFSVSFSKHQIVILQTKKIRLNFLLKLLDLKSDFTLTLGYLNPALNNPAQLTICFLQALSKNGKIYGSNIMVGVMPCIEKVRFGVYSILQINHCQLQINCTLNLLFQVHLLFPEGLTVSKRVISSIKHQVQLVGQIL